MSTFDIDAERVACGPAETHQRLVGKRATVEQIALTDTQQIVTEALRRAYGVIHVARFEVGGDRDECHRAAAVGVVRHALFTDWTGRGATIELYPTKGQNPASVTNYIRLSENSGTWQTESSPNWLSNMRHALLDPPYGVRQDQLWPTYFDDWLTAWFGLDAYEALKNNPQKLDARVWDSAICPTFFKAGEEWWGAYLWTFWPDPKEQIVIAMTASATD